MRSHSKFSDRYDRSNENERATDRGHARHHFPSLWLPHLDQPTYGPYDEASHPREEAQMVSSHAALRARANRRRGPLAAPDALYGFDDVGIWFTKGAQRQTRR
jgi:hypothetical protein